MLLRSVAFCRLCEVGDGLTSGEGSAAHAVAVGEPGAAEMTSAPGAMMSMQLPPLEKLAMPSPSCTAPTAVTEGTRAGLSLHASAVIIAHLAASLLAHNKPQWRAKQCSSLVPDSIHAVWYGPTERSMSPAA